MGKSFNFEFVFKILIKCIIKKKIFYLLKTENAAQRLNLFFFTFLSNELNGQKFDDDESFIFSLIATMGFGKEKT